MLLGWCMAAFTSPYIAPDGIQLGLPWTYTPSLLQCSPWFGPPPLSCPCATWLQRQLCQKLVVSAVPPYPYLAERQICSLAAGANRELGGDWWDVGAVGTLSPFRRDETVGLLWSEAGCDFTIFFGGFKYKRATQQACFFHLC